MAMRPHGASHLLLLMKWTLLSLACQRVRVPARVLCAPLLLLLRLLRRLFRS